MVSGRARAPKPDRRSSPLAAAPFLAALACALSLSSCGLAGRVVSYFESRRAAAFAAELRSLDETLSRQASLEDKRRSVAAAFERARGKAGSEDEWLSLLKRAPVAEAQGDSGRGP